MGFWHLIFGYYGGGEPTPIRIYTTIGTLFGTPKTIGTLFATTKENGIIHGTPETTGVLSGDDSQ